MPTCAVCKSDFPPGEKFCPNDGSELKDPSSQDPKLGMAIGNYRITEKLGEGGMGAVYKAVHPGIGSAVAVKFLHPECAARPEILSRFFDEARAANKIRHPNIIEITDFGTLPDQSGYMVMELLEGRDLKKYLAERGGSLSPDEVKRFFVPVCSALAAAHKAGIVHRDLKPENIFLAREAGGEVIKLVDFGIAKLQGDGEGGLSKTKTGMLMGTPAYMS